MPSKNRNTGGWDPGALTDVGGLAVGHTHSPTGRTGCTVILFEKPFSVIADVRGGAAGTRETAAFHRLGCDPKADAIALVGGSTFGLASVDGVLSFLVHCEKGQQTSAAIVPRVPAAVIYDLGVAKAGAYPNAQMGTKACNAAMLHNSERGNVGAGFGATVGKVYGKDGWMKGGTGTASFKLSDGVVVSALAVVNSFGDVLNPKSQEPIAGTLKRSKRKLADSSRILLTGRTLPPRLQQPNTTLVVVATNLCLSCGELAMVTQAAHDGIATTISPCHTERDGDVAFAVSTGNRRGSLMRVLVAAKRVTQMAILDGVLSASSLKGLPALRDMPWFRQADFEFERAA